MKYRIIKPIPMLIILSLAMTFSCLELQFNQKSQIDQKRRSSCMVLGQHYFKLINEQFENLTKQFSQLKKKLWQSRVLNDLYKICQEKINQEQIQYILLTTKSQDLANQQTIIVSKFKIFYEGQSLPVLLEKYQKQEQQMTQRKISQAHKGGQELTQSGHKLSEVLNKLKSQLMMTFNSIVGAFNQIFNVAGQLHKQGKQTAQKIKKIWDQL